MIRADLRESVHFSIDPERNRIQGAKFSQAKLIGLLRKYELEVE
ncbi:MAG: hypothetical protein AAGI23_22075 [Bacteroidota bacterium]